MAEDGKIRVVEYKYPGAERLVVTEYPIQAVAHLQKRYFKVILKVSEVLISQHGTLGT